jgi:rhamnogalacturonyl hydrolase YesR
MKRLSFFIASGSFFLLFFLGHMAVTTSPVEAAITNAQADSAYSALMAVYFDTTRKVFYLADNKTGFLDFWMYPHTWEMILNVYIRTQDSTYLKLLKTTYTAFLKYNWCGSTWSNNNYNDDITWWTLGLTQAYLVTKDTAYRSMAKKYFDWVYSTQCDTVWGGGVWWMNTQHVSKNSCVNIPMVLVAANLYNCYSDTSYLSKSVSLMAWVKKRLVNDTATCRLNDRVENGVGLNGTLTYTAGVFVSASYALFCATGDSAYFKDAIKMADYVKNHMCNANGILPDEGTAHDNASFKSVFVNRMMKFIIDGKQTQYLAWMEKNGETVWKNRRTRDNIMWYHWDAIAPDTNIEAQAATGGAALLQLLAIANAQAGIVTRQVNKNALFTIPSRNSRVFSLDGREIKTGTRSASAVRIDGKTKQVLIRK